MANGVIRRFGPTLGEGVVIEEREGQRQIQAGLFGVVAWSGILEKGPTDELIEIVSSNALTRQTGGVISGTDVPDNGQDYWRLSRGAGRMYLSRITDGTDRKATLTLKSRETTGEGLGVWRDVLQLDAKSGGRWAGAYNRRIAEFPNNPATDLTETTLDTGLTLLLDEFAGGVLTLTEVANKSYEIVSNTIVGVVTVKSDATMSTDYGAGTNNEFQLFKSNVDAEGTTKKLAVLAKEGVRSPSTEFGLEFYQNGVKVLNWDDASMDPNSDVYVVPLVNDFAGNYEVTATDLFTLTGGTVTASVRPANQFGTIQTGLAATVLPIEYAQPRYAAANVGDGTVGTFVAGSAVQPDLFTLTVTNDTVVGSEVWSVSSAQQDKAFPDATTAVAYPLENIWSVGFTITAGASNWTNGDQIFLAVEPLVEDEAIGGRVYYDYGTDPSAALEIVDNDETTVTVRPQNDLTALTSSGNLYRLQYQKGLTRGYDGHAGVTVSHHRTAWDPATSLFNRLRGKNLGLVKFATPGVTDTLLQQDVRDYAEQYGGENRYELPTASVTTDIQAVNYVQDTLGRADLAVVTFPSFYNKPLPSGNGTKEVSMTGLIQGLEARYAVQAQGYHVQAIGEGAVLSGIHSLPTGEVEPDRELLRPKGIQSVKKVGTNFVHWGNSVPNLNTTSSSKKNKREQLSHYENVLRENFGFIIFLINDPDTRDDARTALRAYFLPEWQPKRALRGNKFADAVTIKIDDSNNTLLTEAAGDLHAEISLRIVDLVDRFVIGIGEQGIFETLAA